MPSSLTIASGGTGYTSAPTVKVRQGNGGAIVPNVTATATLDGDSVDSISISGSGNNNLVGTFIIEISSPPLIEDRFIVLADPVTNDIMYVGEGQWTSGTTLKFTPTFQDNYTPWNNKLTTQYKVQVLESIKKLVVLMLVIMKSLFKMVLVQVEALTVLRYQDLSQVAPMMWM